MKPGRVASAVGVLLLACAGGLRAEPAKSRTASAAVVGEVVEWVWERSEFTNAPAILEVGGDSGTAERIHVHPLSFRDRFGVHWTPRVPGRVRLRVRDRDGKVLRAWTVRVAEPPTGLTPSAAERWLARNGAGRPMSADVQPRLMSAIADHFIALRRLHGSGQSSPQLVAAHATQLAAHGVRVAEFSANLAPPWAPALRPPAVSQGRFLELARGFAADASALAAQAGGLSREDLGSKLDQLERDRCSTCHNEFRFVRLTRSDPARAPSGVYAQALRAAGGPAATGDVANGLALFARHCHACHGDGERRGAARKLLKTEPANLADPGFLYQRSDLELVHTMMGGGADRGLSVEMPAFGTTLDELEMWDIVAWLRAGTSGPSLDLARYEELPWGARLPVPDDATEELSRVMVWRGVASDGAARLWAATPSGAVLVATGVGDELRRHQPAGLTARDMDTELVSLRWAIAIARGATQP